MKFIKICSNIVMAIKKRIVAMNRKEKILATMGIFVGVLMSIIIGTLIFYYVLILYKNATISYVYGIFQGVLVLLLCGGFAVSENDNLSSWIIVKLYIINTGALLGGFLVSAVFWLILFFTLSAFTFHLPSFFLCTGMIFTNWLIVVAIIENLVNKFIFHKTADPPGYIAFLGWWGPFIIGPWFFALLIYILIKTWPNWLPF